VQLLGPKPSADLPAYLAVFDLFLMCYTGDRNMAQMANPHKILEYLSTGRVVVSHYIDEYKDKNHLLEMVEDNKNLPQHFQEVVKELQDYNYEEKQEMRKAFAKENTYSKQVERVENLIGKSNW